MKFVVFQEGNFFHKMSWRRILSRLALRFFHRSSPKLPRLNMILPECKQVLHFLVMSKNKMYKWCKNLWFCCERRNKKMQLYQRFDVDVVPPACNFIKNKILAHMFPFEFCELSILSLYWKWDPGTGVSLRILIIFLVFNFVENETLAH